MALTFYYGSGSPFAWKAWLALHHKGISHDSRRLLFNQTELKGPEFMAKNPRGKVPAIDHDGFILWESSAIVDYLDAAFPDAPVWPKDPHTLGTAKRIAMEADNHLYPAVRRLVLQTLFKPAGDGDPNEIKEAKPALAEELARFSGYLSGDHFATVLSGADYTIYPFLRLVERLAQRQPQHAVALPDNLLAFARRIDALPYTALTEPPHWSE